MMQASGGIRCASLLAMRKATTRATGMTAQQVHPGGRRSITLAAAAFAALAMMGGALAQSPVCDRYRAELASLSSGGGAGRAAQFEAAAQRQFAELQRTRAYAQSLGCNRQQFLFFGEPPPAECRPLLGRISQMQANLRQLESQADQASGGGEARRRALLAAIDQNCRPGGPRGFFEQLFGGQGGQPTPPSDLPELDGPPGQEQAQRLGGSKAVCVRTCDGFFFPLSTSSGGRGGADEMCKALCPGAETEAFFMGQEINSAVSTRGTPYTSLPNAFAYTKTFDAACTCKKPDETWAQVLRNAESMIERRRTDIYVTEAKAEELSRVQPPTAAEQKRAAAQKSKAEAAADAQLEAAAAAEAASGAAAPTASGESAGIGPRNVTTTRTVDTKAGQTREITLPTGEKRNVRVIGSGSIPAGTQVE